MMYEGEHKTHCATCPISGGCTWGCLRGDDLAEIAELRSTLAWVALALPVLETMCRVAGLKAGKAMAREMIDHVKELL